MKAKISIKDQILTELHAHYGICGACGKKKCAGKTEYSKLPDKIGTDKLLEILDKILPD